jgi:hypothetical protein
MAEEKVRENRIRRVAARRGYELHKTRRRDPHALDYGTYTLVNAMTNGAMYHFTNVGLDEIETFFTTAPKANRKAKSRRH